MTGLVGGRVFGDVGSLVCFFMLVVGGGLRAFPQHVHPPPGRVGRRDSFGNASHLGLPNNMIDPSSEVPFSTAPEGPMSPFAHEKAELAREKLKLAGEVVPQLPSRDD